MAEAKAKVFKVSELPEMKKNDISFNDLVMVSDTSDAQTNAKYVSKKLTIGTLSAALQTGISNTIAGKTASQISAEVQQNVQQNVENKINSTVQTKVEQAVNDLFTELDGGEADF